MKGETGYLLPYGCADALTAYKWIFEELLSFYQNIELSTVLLATVHLMSYYVS